MAKLIFEERNCDQKSVWFHFLREVNGQVARCKLCTNILKTRGGSTKGLHTHLKSMHGINVLKRHLPSSEKVNDGNESFGSKSASTSKITNFFTNDKDESLSAVLSRMIARDGLSINIFCTSIDLRKSLMARGFQNIPSSSNTIRKIVTEYSQKIRLQLIQNLSNRILNGERFSITLDEWTSVKNRRYLNINVHYEKIFWNLGLTRIHGSMSSEKCLQMVEHKLNENGISLHKNIVCITTDGASVMTKLGKLIGAEHQLCLAHAIQLAVISVLYQSMIRKENANEEESAMIELDDSENDNEYEDGYSGEEYEELADGNGLTIIEDNGPRDCLITHEKIYPLIAKVRNVVKKFRGSSTKNDQILQKYVKEQFGKELSLILDSKTRWNSLLAMLERFSYLKNSIKKAFVDLNETNSFTDDEFNLMDSLISVLLPIKLGVEALCRQDANLLTADGTLKFIFKQLKEQNTPLSKAFEDELKIRILKRRTDLSGILQYLHNPHQMVDEDYDNEIFPPINRNAIIKRIVQILQRLCIIHDEVNVPIISLIDKVVEHTDIEATQPVSLQEKLQHMITKNTSAKRSEAAFQTQKKNSKDLSKVIRKELDYLENENSRGKYLTLIYNYLMTIPPTSVESERAFSAAGLLCTKIRSRLADNTIDALTFLRAHFNSNK